MILDTNLISAYLRPKVAEDARRAFVHQCLIDGTASQTLATAETKPAMKLLPELAVRAKTTVRIQFITS